MKLKRVGSWGMNLGGGKGGLHVNNIKYIAYNS